LLYCMLPALDSLPNSWLDVPRGGMSMTTLFSQVEREPGNVGLKWMDGQSLHRTCRALTLGQRCADWFVLRQFRITGTNASNTLMKVNTVRSFLRPSCAPNNDNSRDHEERSSRTLLETFASS
jgi:hypothetical protein